MTTQQQTQLENILQILSERKYRSNQRTIELIQQRGHRVEWKRVTWTGGIGSYKVMRNHRVRVLVCATKSGLSKPKAIIRNLAVLFRSRKRIGYRYGFCVEI